MSVIDKKFIFILGSPRSGTSWLHHLLNDHPDTAGLPHELRTFNAYIVPIVQKWNEEQYAIEQGYFRQGHPSIWSREELDEVLIGFLDKTYSKVLEGNPKASCLLDKHPNYCYAIEEIVRYLPHAKMIHMVRDGRDVVPSLISAKKRLGFGKGTALEATRWWKKCVLAAREGTRKYPERFLEVRYEELREKGPELLPAIFKFCELDFDHDLICELIERNRYEKKVESRPDPKYEELRRKAVPVWKAKLSAWERYQIQAVGGDLLKELGYIKNEKWWCDSTTEWVSILFRRSGNRLKKWVSRMVRRLFGWSRCY